MKNEELKRMATALRMLSVDAVAKANSGHPGLPLGFADVATVLFSEFLKFDSKNPKWYNRDRFILSAGHGSALLYSLLYLTGYDDITIDDIKNNFGKNSILPASSLLADSTIIERNKKIGGHHE